jgi:hypothetical protein
MNCAATVHAVIAHGAVVLAICAAHPRYFKYADLIGIITFFSSSVDGTGSNIIRLYSSGVHGNSFGASKSFTFLLPPAASDL